MRTCYLKSLSILSVLVLFSISALASEENESQKTIDHSKWDQLLSKYVNDRGFVDYDGFKDDVLELDSYLNMLARTAPRPQWGRNEILAYYINLYNAATIKLILQNYPVSSIRNIERAWTKKWIPIASKQVSLDEIEHDILRKMDEPRIHFALNCASVSCPKLSNEAYVATHLDEQLTRAATQFINSDLNQIESRKATISPIFKWYIKDFKIDGKVDLIGYINLFSNIEMDPDAKVMFARYDWNLNKQ